MPSNDLRNEGVTDLVTGFEAGSLTTVIGPPEFSSYLPRSLPSRHPLRSVTESAHEMRGREDKSRPTTPRHTTYSQAPLRSSLGSWIDSDLESSSWPVSLTASPEALDHGSLPSVCSQWHIDESKPSFETQWYESLNRDQSLVSSLSQPPLYTLYTNTQDRHIVR